MSNPVPKSHNQREVVDVDSIMDQHSSLSISELDYNFPYSDSPEENDDEESHRRWVERCKAKAKYKKRKRIKT